MMLGGRVLLAIGTGECDTNYKSMMADRLSEYVSTYISH